MKNQEESAMTRFILVVVATTQSSNLKITGYENT